MPGQPAAESPAPVSDLPGLIWWNRPQQPQRLSPEVRLAAYGELMDREPSLRPHYLATLEEARKSTPDNPIVLAALGRRALAEAKPEAITLLEAALANGSTAELTFFDLAEALSRAGRVPKAIEALQRGVALHPYSRQLRKSLILRHIATKDYTAARLAMREYLDRFPEDSFMRNLLARVEPASSSN
jgi:predicted Zn-dependent protease